MKVGKFHIGKQNLVKLVLLVRTVSRAPRQRGHHMVRQRPLTQVTPLLIKPQSHWIRATPVWPHLTLITSCL